MAINYIGGRNGGNRRPTESCIQYNMHDRMGIELTTAEVAVIETDWIGRSKYNYNTPVASSQIKNNIIYQYFMEIDTV